MNRSSLPLAVELLVSADVRRDRVSVEAHSAFQRSITPPAPEPFDEIDLAVAEKLTQEAVEL